MASPAPGTPVKSIQQNRAYILTEEYMRAAFDAIARRTGLLSSMREVRSTTIADYMSIKKLRAASIKSCLLIIAE